jgi:hypothetical protein
MEQALRYKGLRKKHFNLSEAPGHGRRPLEQQRNAFEVHDFELRGKLGQKCRANVDVKHNESAVPAIVFGERTFRYVRVPKSQDTSQTKFPEKEAGHPAESDLKEVDAF